MIESRTGKREKRWLASRGSRQNPDSPPSLASRAAEGKPSRESRAKVGSKPCRIEALMKPAESGTPANDSAPPAVEVPDYRPIERFWPYLDLPEQPTDEELANLDPALSEALFGTPRRPFSVTLQFPVFEGPDYARALELARGSAEYPRDRGRRCSPSSRALLSVRCAAPENPVRDRRTPGRLRRPHRRSAAAVRQRTLAAADVVPDLLTPMVDPR